MGRFGNEGAPQTSEIDDWRERGQSPRDCGAPLRRRRKRRPESAGASRQPLHSPTCSPSSIGQGNGVTTVATPFSVVRKIASEQFGHRAAVTAERIRAWVTGRSRLGQPTAGRRGAAAAIGDVALCIRGAAPRVSAGPIPRPSRRLRLSNGFRAPSSPRPARAPRRRHRPTRLTPPRPSASSSATPLPDATPRGDSATQRRFRPCCAATQSSGK
jgi:hypothetical protein